MSEFYVVMDALFEPELVTEAKTASNVSESLSEFLAGTRAEFIQTWNMVSKAKSQLEQESQRVCVCSSLAMECRQNL